MGAMDSTKRRRYISERFREIGLEPAGEGGSYFQTFMLTLGGDLGPGNRMSVELGDEKSCCDSTKTTSP